MVGISTGQVALGPQDPIKDAGVNSVKDQASVVQRVGSVINWISCYPVEEICTEIRNSHMNLLQNESKGI